jgi:hypothetical protein
MILFDTYQLLGPLVQVCVAFGGGKPSTSGPNGADLRTGQEFTSGLGRLGSNPAQWSLLQCPELRERKAGLHRAIIMALVAAALRHAGHDNKVRCLLMLTDRYSSHGYAK